MPIIPTKDQSDDGPPLTGLRYSRVRSHSRPFRMDHHEYERRKSRQEMLPAVIIALIVAFCVALMCWLIQ